MIFLDHNAGTPVSPRVGARIRSLLDEGGWSNPSSPHSAGRRARELIEDAREAVARSVGEPSSRITFTSGATEANAAALAHWARLAGARRVAVSTPVEHPSVLEPLRRLQSEGWVVRWAPVGRDGRIAEDWIREAIDDEVGFAATMSAQNETGALHPWRNWAAVCADRGVPLHLDATQSWGKEDLALDGLRGSAAWSGHKVGAPSGVGALWLSDDGGFHGLAAGGSQERGRRSGTESVMAVAGMGEAALSLPDASERGRWSRWRELLWSAVAGIPGVARTVAPDRCLPNTLHLRVPSRAETLVVRLDLEGVAASAGSACASGSMRPSEALLAMGWSPDEALRGMRLSVGRCVDESGVREAAATLVRILS